MNQDDAFLKELNKAASRVVIPARKKDPWKKHVPLSFIEKPDNKTHKPIPGQLELFPDSSGSPVQ